MAIEEETAKSAPAFSSNQLNQSRAATRGTYFVQTQPERQKPLARLKSAAPKANPAKILSMKLKKQDSVFDDPAPESNIHVDLSGFKTVLSRLAMILLAVLVAGGIGYAVYYFVIREKPATIPKFSFDNAINRRLTSAEKSLSNGDYTSAEAALSAIDVSSSDSCTKARYYSAFNWLYVYTYRGNSAPAAETARFAAESLETCLKEGTK